jgi:hypothetical protein
MNETQIEAYCQGFMDKCASAGLDKDQSEELLKQAFKNKIIGWGSKLFKGAKKPPKVGPHGPDLSGKKIKPLGGGNTPPSAWQRTKDWGGKAMEYGGKFMGPLNLATNAYFIYSMLNPGGGQQPQQPEGVQGPQMPGRMYGNPKLNTRGLGGITRYLS